MSSATTASINELDHSLAKHFLSRLRESTTSSCEFRTLVGQLTQILAVEATRSLAVKPQIIETPICRTEGHQIQARIGLVPILRAGLGMLGVMQQLLPQAETWHLGYYRDEVTAKPVPYYQKLVEGRAVEHAFLLDPMLATGGSAIAAIKELRNWGVPNITMLSLIAAPEGIQALREHDPNLELWTCAIDEKLNDQNFIVPGLGDAGDRIFGT